MNANQRLRIAWFSPISGADTRADSSVSAYVSDRLLPYLEQDFDIDLFSDSSDGRTADRRYHYSNALSHNRLEAYDFFFYQVEDHPAAIFSRLHLALVPGVVLFHDLFFKPTPWSSELSRMKRIAAGQLGDDFDPGERQSENCSPFAVSDCRATLVPVFSCERNLSEYVRHRDNSVSSLPWSSHLPHYLPYPVNPGLSRRCRLERESGVALRIGFVGSVQVEHRVHYLLDALSKLEIEYDLLWLINPEEEGEARRLCAQFAVERVRFSSPRSVFRWEELVCDIDIAIHTLFSAYGDPGPYLNVSMMGGVPCVVNDFSAARWLPDRVVRKICFGEGEAEEIRIALIECSQGLARNNRHNAVRNTSLVGLSYAEEFFDAQMVASEAKMIFIEQASYLKNITQARLSERSEVLERALKEAINDS